MKQEEFALNKIMIASPCSIGWENMEGDERVRFCKACQLNVYNTSQMTNNEIMALMANDKSSCLRIYRRADRTMMTDDCPIGLRRVRNAAKRMTKRLAQVAASIWALTFSMTGAIAKSNTKHLNHWPENLSSAQWHNHQKHPLSITDQPVDATAYKYFQAARANVAAKQSAEAEENFMKASIALSKVPHDPVFANLVWTELADFLETQKRESEAAAIRKMVKATSHTNPRFTFNTPMERHSIGQIIDPGPQIHSLPRK